MKITKHGKYHSKNQKRINLFGRCAVCGCEFTTYVNVHPDVPNVGDFTFITDTECKNMKIVPHYTTRFEPYFEGAILQRADYSSACPECTATVTLEPIDVMED